MKTFQETLNTPIKGEYDIIVVGAGPAGCGVSLAAAREGMKVLLIDKENSLGGMWTVGFMNPLFDAEKKDGIIAELIDELKSKNQWGGFWGKSFHNEYMKHILDNKMREAGVSLLLNTNFVRSITENKTVKGVVVENIEGRSAYLGRMTIDCSGDGHVAADAGCEFQIGVDGDYKQCQGMTLMYLVGNIPEKHRAGLMVGEILDECYHKAGKEAPFHVPYIIPVPNSHFGVMQFTHMYGYNPLSVVDIAEASAEGRRQMIEAVELLNRYSEDFKELELITSAGVLGVRESRRIVGDYTLTLEDVLTEGGFKTDDSVCRVTFNMDIHTAENKGQNCRVVQAFQVPFRCLIPKGFDGILTAGRCISGTHETMAAYRVTGDCCKMGENAGKIAAYALKRNVSVRDVIVSEVI